MYHAPIAAAAAPEDEAAAPGRDRFLAGVAALWLCACAVLTAIFWHNIATLHLPDPDDQLRLVEVRDWLGGQGFYDVSQHRMTPPVGAPMHWSRLVDMPVAALILLFRPLAGDMMAQRIAAATVPLVTLGLAMLLVALVTRRLAGRGAGLLAAAFAATAVFPVLQMQPMRIDHHGWEIVLALAACGFALRGETLRDGVCAGIAAAIGMQVSLENMPMAVAVGAILAGHWALAPRGGTRARLLGFVGALTLGEGALFAALHRPDQWGVFCDAVSPPHLLGLAVATGGLALVTWRAPAVRWLRFAALAGVAALAAAAFHAVPPGCGLDAFAALEPIVRTHWYEHVAEGQPIWRQSAGTGWGVVMLPLLALGCCARAWSGTRRADWALYAAMLVAATLVGALVLRASALANMLAVPAVAWAAMRLVLRAQASPRPLVRVFGSTAALLAFSPWTLPLAAVAALPPKTAGATARAVKLCTRPEAIRALAALPPGRIFAPLDFGPSILLETRHAIFASGYHRNHTAIAEELRAMLGTPAAARAMLARRGIDYVVTCPHYAEMQSYAEDAPTGFAAALDRGAAPGWLAPLRVPGTPLKAWRVR